MDPRLRTAVDASRRWYDDVFGLHAIPVRVERGLWSALGQPPALPLRGEDPDAGSGDRPRHRARWTPSSTARWPTPSAISSSTGTASTSSSKPAGCIVLPRTAPRGRSPSGGRWSTPPSRSRSGASPTTTRTCCPRPSSTTLASGSWPATAAATWSAAAITHQGDGDVGLSNAWGVGAADQSDELLAAASALHPGQAFTDYEQGAELEALLAAGFSALGPQRVWVR